MLLLTVVYYYGHIRSLVHEINFNGTQLEHAIVASQKIHQDYQNYAKKNFSMKAMDQVDLIQYIIKKINDSGFSLEKIHPEYIHQKENMEFSSFNLSLSGEFSKLSSLMNHMYEGPLLLSVTEMKVSDIEKSKIKIDMLLDIFNVFMEKKEQAHSSEIEFSWIGYKKMNHKIFALLKMSNGHVSEVSEGSLLENGLGKIVSLNTETMIITLDKHQQIIHYGQSLSFKDIS